MFGPRTDSGRTASTTAEGIADVRLSRRGVVRAGMWAVPAVTVAAAAPAYAGSGSNSVEFLPAGTSITGSPLQDLQFSGARLRIWGTPDPGAVLTMTVTFVPFPDQTNQVVELFVPLNPTNWSSPQWGQVTSLATFHYAWSDSLTNGTTVVIPDVVFVGTLRRDQLGTFYVTFDLPGLAPAVAVFASSRQ